jgi:hypothetical protein
MKWKLHLPKWLLHLLPASGLSFATVFLATYPSYQMTERDEVEAVRSIVAWIAEHKPLPGLEEEYPDGLLVENMDVVVTCDFLPPDAHISPTPRIRRVTANDYRAHLHDTYWRADYLKIEIKEKSNKKIVFEASNIISPMAGHGYKIEFQKKIYGLRSKVEFLWII